MRASLYEPVYMALILLLSCWIGFRYINSPDYSRQEKGGGSLFPLILCIVLAFWIGYRPISYLFGDTGNYAYIYRSTQIRNVTMNWHQEWVWQWFIILCRTGGLGVEEFFTLVATGYILSAFWAVKRLMPNNPMLGMLFVLASLMFFAYGVNGIRNGLACHLVLLAISFLLDDKYLVGIFLSLVAFGIHRSTLLPIAATFAGIFLIRDTRYSIIFWVASIFISLVAGDTVSGFFASLGFDDRMTEYTTARGIDMRLFSRTGFRWDFLLYSAAPVVMAWYVCVKRQIRDSWYDVICTAYCLCNAFWIMVIRAAFSNRFAYLSWFLYPLVIAYPLINLPIWEDQDRKTGWILLAYSGFSVFMLLFVW